MREVNAVQSVPTDPCNRREMLFRFAQGLGGLALLDLLGQEQGAAAGARNPAAKAKAVIFLYMDGGPSHIDTFDPKPRLRRDHGKPMPFSVVGRFSTNLIMGSPYTFRKFGQSGIEVSEIFPHLAQCADKLTIVRSMVAEHMEHPSASYFMFSGSGLRGRPSLGSWITYGLGSECRDLPGYIVLYRSAIPQGGPEIFGSGFLPAQFKRSMWDMDRLEPVDNVVPRDGSPSAQLAKLRTIARLNSLSLSQFRHTQEVDAAAASYELAFRMQKAVPQVLGDDQETATTKKLYGMDNPRTAEFGRQCLAARRLVERGVRFVVLVPPTVEGSNRWDQHDDLAEQHRGNAELVDKPIAGLLTDLDARGLLNQTLVMWGGEFGRTPMAELNTEKPPGREHNPHGFTIWLAGGGTKPGIVHGATDEFGYAAVEDPVTVHDLHATILHLLGIDHTRLTFNHGGRDFRLTDVYGNVVQKLLA
jgi:hypothetical protein